MDKRATRRTDAALLAAERSGLRLGIWGRLIASALFAIWQTGAGSAIGSLTPLIAIAGFAGLSALHLWLMARRLERTWHRYVIVAVDALALGWIAANAPLYQGGEVPQIMVFRAYGVAYVFFFLAASTLSLSPGLVLFTGVSLVAALWGAFLSIILGMERTVSWSDLPPGYTAADYIALLTDPDFTGTGNRIEESLFLLASAAILALATQRARALVRAEAEAQAARVNLARYVPPDLVEDLAAQSEPFGPVRRQQATILFVDLVGFTTFAENRDPAEVIDFLRIFHARVAEEVFAHRGTLEDFIGDEVLAVFGTPAVRDDDAARAIACADSIRRSIADWNADRLGRGEEPVRIGIGLHTGEVVVGTTGTERRLKFTVIGDTVNIASRLQGATRVEACEALYSLATLRAANRADADLVNARPIQIRGISTGISAVPSYVGLQVTTVRQATPFTGSGPRNS